MHLDNMKRGTKYQKMKREYNNYVKDLREKQHYTNANNQFMGKKRYEAEAEKHNNTQLFNQIKVEMIKKELKIQQNGGNQWKVFYVTSGSSCGNLLYGRISQKVSSSRKRRAMSCVVCDPKSRIIIFCCIAVIYNVDVVCMNCSACSRVSSLPTSSIRRSFLTSPTMCERWHTER